VGIKVKAMHHANVRLQTPDQAEDFYGRVLGLQRDPSMPWSDERRLMWWNIPGGAQIHTPIGERVNQTPSGRPIGAHFALAVDDIQEAKRTLEGKASSTTSKRCRGAACSCSCMIRRATWWSCSRGRTLSPSPLRREREQGTLRL